MRLLNSTIKTDLFKNHLILVNSSEIRWKSIILLILVITLPVWGQLSELPLKAFFLQAALRFITWPTPKEVPADTTKSFTIGHFKNDKLAFQLKQLLLKKEIKGKQVSFLQIDSLAQIDYCDLLLLSETEKKNITTIIHKIQNKPILTVGTYQNFINSGVHMCLLIENQKIACYINEEETLKSKFKISYHLLQKSKISKTGYGT